MKKSKTVIAMLMALTMTAALAGCGSSSGSSSAASSGGSDAAASSAAASSAASEAADTSAASSEAAAPAASGDETTYTLAVVGPMTGDSANNGTQFQRAAEMAIEEINAKADGYQLAIVVGDDQAQPNQGLIVAEKFASDDSILGIVGHNNSGVTMACLETYSQYGMPVVSPTCTATDLTEAGYDNFFRVIMSDKDYKAQYAQLGIEKFGATKPAIFWENTDYGKGGRDVVANWLEENGIELVEDLSYNPSTDRDFSAQITKMKESGVDLVYVLSGEYTAGALFTKQAKTLGLEATLFGAGDCYNPNFLEISGDAGEGFHCLTAFDATNPAENVQEFVKAYQSKFNEMPGEWAAHAYDTVQAYAKAIEAGATDRASCIEKLRDVTFEGVSGHIEFDEKGDVVGKETFLTIIQDGAFVADES
ncbi:MAG: ABC transporter substrate-binding protein [Eubacterium sp.]|nr:ABC transporter substrate-binding protein [Eubacterium sp.]